MFCVVSWRLILRFDVDHARRWAFEDSVSEVESATAACIRVWETWVKAGAWACVENLGDITTGYL